MKVYSLKSCDTCRKALRDIRESGIEPEVVDVRADGLSADDIAAIIAAFGDKALNKASTTWRGLSDAEKAEDVSSLLAKHPTLLKRPVIVLDGAWHQGWKPETKAAVLDV